MNLISLLSARKDAILPLSTPIRANDGSTINEVLIPKNSTVFVAIQTLNTDPLTWGPDATEWKPERWLSPLPESVTNAHIPGVYSNMYVHKMPHNTPAIVHIYEMH